MSAEPIDFAAVKAEHLNAGSMEVDPTGPDHCAALGCSIWPCLPYRLAVEAERLAGVLESTLRTGRDVLRERDEARRHVNALADEVRVWQRKHVDKVAAVVRVETERDEARAEAERLAGKVARVKDLPDQWDTEEAFGGYADGLATAAYELRALLADAPEKIERRN